MWPDSTWAVVPCPGSRAAELEALIGSCDIPAERLVTVTTEKDPLPVASVVLPYEGMWISRWWNAGLDRVEELVGVGEPHEVFLPGSDVIGRPWSVAALAVEMRRHGLTMVGPHLGCEHTSHGPEGKQVDVYLEFSPRDVWRRVPGACMMLAGEHGTRVDERFRWWYSDDDLEVQARHGRGAGLVHGTALTHAQDHTLDAEQAAHAVEDRALFVEKWGREPW